MDIFETYPPIKPIEIRLYCNTARKAFQSPKQFNVLSEWIYQGLIYQA
jgi:hypothetical protein